MERRFYLVDAQVLPEVFLKVVRAKELLASGEARSISAATRAVELSRSAFYKYKDSITAFQDLRHGHILTFQVMLRDQTGLLSAVLSVFFGSPYVSLREKHLFSACKSYHPRRENASAISVQGGH